MSPLYFLEVPQPVLKKWTQQQRVIRKSFGVKRCVSWLTRELKSLSINSPKFSWGLNYHALFKICHLGCHASMGFRLEGSIRQTLFWILKCCQVFAMARGVPPNFQNRLPHTMSWRALIKYHLKEGTIYPWFRPSSRDFTDNSDEDPFLVKDLLECEGRVYSFGRILFPRTWGPKHPSLGPLSTDST